MKNFTKKIIAVIAVLCVSASAFAGCSGKKEDSSNQEEAMMKFPLEVGEPGDGNPLSGDPDLDLDAEDPTEPADKPTEAPAPEEIEEVEDVTDAKGQPVTEIAEVTEAGGNVVTTDGGAPLTTAVKVTTVVKKPAPTQAPTEAPTKAYTPKNDARYAMWLDISKDENFYFNGAYLKMTFKVKDNAPDGDYRIRITTDLSTIEGKVIYPDKVIDGTIRVNNGSIDPIDVSSETGMVFYGDNVACKQGDTIDYYFYIENNAGLAAFCNWCYFDSNALEYKGYSATGEFEKIAKNTAEVGEGNNDLNK